MKKKILLIILLVVMSLSLGVYLLPKNNAKTKLSLENNNMLSFTVDGIESKTMPTKGSGYIASKITCTNGSIIVFDNDNWTIEVEKLETDDACYIDFVTNGVTKEYDYTGNIEVFTAPTTNEYILEVWGASGGGSGVDSTIGYGGYSTGIVSLTEGEKLYITVGGEGKTVTTATTLANGGYNGGGNAYSADNQGVNNYGSGGGATHIAKTTGLLNTLSNNISDILIVAGGGAGSAYYKNGTSYYHYGSGGSGGGYTGASSYNGYSSTQTVRTALGGSQSLVSSTDNYIIAGSFGQGANANTSGIYSGGGGGFYGGQTAYLTGSGGGSGYIGNSLLTNKVMYCYKCTANSSESTKTISTENVSSTPTSNYAKIGNGYVKIKELVKETKTIKVNIESNYPEYFDSTSKTTTEGGKVTFYSKKEIDNVTNCDYELKENVLIINNVTSLTTCLVTFKSSNKTLYDQLLTDNPTIKERTDFSTAFTDTNSNTLYKSTENNKEVYYFAGNATDNWVKFVGYYWRIIRTNSDGSIRLIYSGESTTSTNAVIGSSYYNSAYDPMYNGYMYGTSGSLNNNRTNTNNSIIKSAVDSWYQNNLINYENYISKSAIYCNDRNLASGYTYSTSSSNPFIYLAYARLETNNTPSFNCTNANDKFTVDSSTGNGKLTYPIALITADELSFIGWRNNVLSKTWLYYNANSESITGSVDWWTMTPRAWVIGTGDNRTYNYKFLTTSSGMTFNYSTLDASIGIRPVISLKGDSICKSGDGSSSNPYEIEMN